MFSSAMDKSDVQPFSTTILNSVPFKRVQCSDEVLGIAWKPKASIDSNMFYVYTKSGIIEEKKLVEKENYTMDLSCRGSITFSSYDKKKLHTVPFFEQNMLYEKFISTQFKEREAVNAKAMEY